jgi:hypothetical protein
MNDKLRTAARLLARYSYNMGENIANADNYEFWHAKYMGARYMLFALTGLDGTTIGNEDNEVIVMLSDDSNHYTFDFKF